MKTPHENSLGSTDRAPFSRRSFIGTALAGAGALMLPSSLTVLAADGACTPTTRDLYGLGPFHEANAPFRMELAAAGEPGRRLTITGIVTARDCTTPLGDVVVDVWGANDAGCYTEIDANGNLEDSCTPRPTDPYNLRGRMRTGPDGVYSFTTIVPGRYLNGGVYRPSHIHFIITAPGRPGLVTQLYFEGDPYIPGDLAAGDPSAVDRIIPLVEGDEGLAGRFDIILDVGAPTSVARENGAVTADDLAISRGNPLIEECVIDYVVASAGRVDLMIFDATGAHVRTLVDAVHAPGRYDERWDGRNGEGGRVAAGAYLCRLRTSSSVASRTIAVE